VQEAREKCVMKNFIILLSSSIILVTKIEHNETGDECLTLGWGEINTQVLVGN